MAERKDAKNERLKTAKATISVQGVATILFSYPQ